MVAGTLQLPSLLQGLFGRQLREIAGRRRTRGFCDADIFFRAEPASKPIRTFLKKARDDLLLPFIECSTELIVKLCFRDQKFDPAYRTCLRFKHCSRKIYQPVGNFIGTVGPRKRRIIRLLVAFNRIRQCNQRWLTQTLRKGFFSYRPANPPVANSKS